MRRQRRGFSVIELMVVIGIAGVLASLTASALMRARQQARDTGCINNLRQIGESLVHYAEHHDGRYPVKLRPYLEDFVEQNKNIWVCPADELQEAAENSYGEFYIPRFSTKHSEGWDVAVRCPRHPHGDGWLNLVFDGSTSGDSKNSTKREGIYHPIIESGTTLPDGSTVSGQNMMILMARREGSLQRWHVVMAMLKTPLGDQASGRFQVTPGTRFEVITPAGVAAVEGTEFDVTSKAVFGNYQTSVAVTQGKVRVKSWDEPQGKSIQAGQSRTILRPEPIVWPGRYKKIDAATVELTGE